MRPLIPRDPDLSEQERRARYEKEYFEWVEAVNDKEAEQEDLIDDSEYVDYGSRYDRDDFEPED